MFVVAGGEASPLLGVAEIYEASNEHYFDAEVAIDVLAVCEIDVSGGPGQFRAQGISLEDIPALQVVAVDQTDADDQETDNA